MKRTIAIKEHTLFFLEDNRIVEAFIYDNGDLPEDKAFLWFYPLIKDWCEGKITEKRIREMIINGE